ncbi:Dolichyl-phosphate-mannose-protein mannosyltransferase [Salinimicrobium sediminis]|uniref:Dolichyl-phosphate-mannose-protein mannosyltransferase n=1 Tax=Salinimicrobium sediminis TaxID=1343891 RepID=A0A285WZR2_9FLAO|nr:glycosyltransferase family 39 protein [Salinimicrobium sediminis]SOC78577.1 Dolichyl-phosphate-mannose-protein mannosyltransferase [Salinimicrobium sediminis]
MEKIDRNFIYKWVKKAFYLVVIGLVFLIFLAIFFRSDLRGVESNVIYSVQLALEDNGLLYSSPEAPPFNITQYSPLYYILSDVIITSLFIEADEYFIIRVVTRTISVLLLLLSFLVVRDILRKFIGFKKNASLIIALAFFVISFPWFNISRPDVLVLLFFSLSVRSVMLYQKDGNKTNTAILLGIFLALGILSKLTMGLYIMAFGFYMIIAKQWRLAFFSAISCVLSLFLMSAIIQLLGYDLSYLHENIIQGVNNGISINLAWETSYKPYLLYFGLFSLIFILFVIIYLKNWKYEKTDTDLLFLITLSCSVAVFSFFSALKVGSAINYFNELLLCLILFTISFLKSYHIIKKKLYLIGFMVFGVSIGITHFFNYGPRLMNNFVHLTSGNEQEGDISEIIGFLNSNLGSGYFYSDNIDIAQSFPNRSVLFPTPIHLITYKREVYDYSVLKKWAKENLRFIIIHPNRTNLYGIDIKKHYSLKIKYRNYYLYELISNTQK